MSQQQEQDMQFQIECLTQDLVRLLMEERGLSIEQAMEAVYASHTYEKVEDQRTGLYYQSAVYVADMLQEELNTK